MRKMFMILVSAIALMAFSATGVMAAPLAGLTVLGSGFTLEMPEGMDIGDKFGGGGGVLFNASSNIGVMGLYEYIKTDFMAKGEEVTWSTVSAYGVVTLVPFSKGVISGLAGLEWFDTNVTDVDTGDPDFTYGLMGQGNFSNGIGVWGTVTSTMADDTDLLDIIKARAGLSYTF